MLGSFSREANGLQMMVPTPLKAPPMAYANMNNGPADGSEFCEAAKKRIVEQVTSFFQDLSEKKGEKLAPPPYSLTVVRDLPTDVVNTGLFLVEGWGVVSVHFARRLDACMP